MSALRIIDRTVEGVAVIIFAASSLLICLNVLNRYLVLGLMRDIAKTNEAFRPTYFAIREFMGTITVTADEIPGLLLAWIAFLGAYLAMRREGHIAFDMIVTSLSRRAQKLLAIANACLMSGFLLILFWQSVRMIRVAGATEIVTAEIAQGWFMLIMPLAAVLLLLATLVRLVETLGSSSTPAAES